MAEVADFSKASGNCKHRSLEACLLEALEEVRAGRWKDCDGIIVIAKEQSPGKYYHGYTRAGMYHSECVVLLENAKFEFLHEMNPDCPSD